MLNNTEWNDIRLGQAQEDQIWELFHENSKTSPYDSFITQEELREKMLNLVISEKYEEFAQIPLSKTYNPLDAQLGATMLSRVTARNLSANEMSLDDLTALLHYSYGETRSNAGTEFPHPFRVIPSGGALYPLEIYFHTAKTEGLEPGFYHYTPTTNSIQLLHESDESSAIAASLVQPELALGASVIFFITAVFPRCTFKYGNRGYRFAFIEAGHLAQNMNLAATALGWATVNIGGFLDRKVDRLLGIDGVSHSTIYMVAAGKQK